MSKKFKVPTIKPGTPVIVHWFDAHQDASEMGEAKDLLDGECEILDVGFWMGQKGKFITIAVEKYLGSWQGQYRHVNRIPKVNLIDITVLHVPTDSSGTDNPIHKTSESDGSSGDGGKPRARRKPEPIVSHRDTGVAEVDPTSV